MKREFTDAEVSEAKEAIKKLFKKRHEALAKENVIDKHLKDRRVNKKDKETDDILELMEILSDKDIRPIFLMTSDEYKRMPDSVCGDVPDDLLKLNSTLFKTYWKS